MDRWIPLRLLWLLEHLAVLTNVLSIDFPDIPFSSMKNMDDTYSNTVLPQRTLLLFFAMCNVECAFGIVHPQSGFCVNLTSFHFDTAFFLDAAAITISAIVQPLFEPLATLRLWQLTAKRSLCICQDKTPWVFHFSPFTRYPFTQLNSCVMLICYETFQIPGLPCLQLSL